MHAGSPRVTPVKIPVSRYTSPEFFAREMESVWPQAWQLACSVDHVAHPGDFHEHRVGAISVLVVRGDDGELRAFQNVCRHRGSALLRGIRERPDRDPLPVPPLDVGPRRTAARGAVPPGVRALAATTTYLRRSSTGAGRHVGTARLREPRRRRRATRRLPRAGSRRLRVGPPRRVPVHRGGRRCRRRATGRRSSTDSARRTTCRACTARCSPMTDDVNGPQWVWRPPRQARSSRTGCRRPGSRDTAATTRRCGRRSSR